MKRDIQPDWIKYFREIGKELIDDYKNRNIIGPLGDSDIEIVMKKCCNANKQRYIDFYGTDYKEMYYSFLIVYLASTIHETLGNGFKEVVYQDALEQEFIRAGIPYAREKHLVIYYNNDIIRPEKEEEIELQNTFRADFFCAGNIIVELKATFLREHRGTDPLCTSNHSRRSPRASGGSFSPGKIWKFQLFVLSLRAQGDRPPVHFFSLLFCELTELLYFCTVVQ